MANRDDGFGMGFGIRGYDPHAQWEGPLATRGVVREPGRGRRFSHDEDMGGSNWSGASGRGGIAEGRSGVPREHGGFSNYAGGGDRDSGRFGGHGERQDRERDWRPGYEAPRYGETYGSPYPPGGGSFGYGHGARSPYGAYEEPQRGAWGREEPMARMHPYEHHEPMMRSGYGHGQEPMRSGYGGAGQMPEPMHAYGDEDRGPHYGKGPKGYKRSDERIREEVCESIARQGYIDAGDVEVMVEGGVVRLVGTVVHRGDKRGLEQIAERVHGVGEVWNELRLKREATGRNEGPMPMQGQAGQTAQPNQTSPQQPAPQQSMPQNGRNARS